MARPLLIVVLLLAAASATVDAQNPDEPRATLLFQNVTRAESWSFFDPADIETDSDYTLVSNRARLGVRVDTRRIAFEGAFQYAQLLGLPDRAFGPGPLGPGALYFASAGMPEAYQLYFKSMSLTIKDVVPRLSMRVGRMSYASDEETPYTGRLIGNVEWTPFERAFDGVRVDYLRQSWRIHAAFIMPTQGAFEESANPTIGKVQVSTVEFNSRYGQLFAHSYRDTRAVTARPDNTGFAADRADIRLHTVGGSAALAGIHVWAAVQRGEWYGDSHRAFSLSADAGRRWDRVRWAPRAFAGVMYASGDDDPNDRRHGTFFPMLPTTRPDVLRGTYAQMNLRDVYAGVEVHPRTRLRLSAEVHVLALADRQDRWYSGTGATAIRGEYFGFTSRRSTLRHGLGTLTQASLAMQMKPRWTLRGALGVVRGGDVVRRQFTDSTLWVAAVESAVSFGR